jgi:aspartate 1-decarboxylase
VIRFMLKSKIYRATVTDSDLHYEGSLTLDETLMKAADIFPFEHVHVYNITNGHRFETYVIRGEKDSGIICVNGAAAHLARKGDLVIIASYGLMEGRKLKSYKPKLVFVGGNNKVIREIAQKD